MNARPIRLALCAALAVSAATAGCRSTVKAEFAVSLHNASDRPVTVWLTKTGGPDETDWLPPEAFSDSRAAAVDRINGVTIPPGKTGFIGPIKGTFDNDSLAVLRVYSGQLKLDAMLATGVDSSLRVDVPLREGENHLQVEPGAKLAVEPAAEK